MGAIRARRVDFIPQPGQQNLPVAKIDFFPANRVSTWNEPREMCNRQSGDSVSHFTILQTVLVTHGDRLRRHHPTLPGELADGE